MKTLVILAHPDDETMVGYALLRCAAEGEVWVVVASHGTASTINHRSESDFVASGRRREESEQSLLGYGVDLGHQVYLELPDGQLDQCHEAMTKVIGKLIDQHLITRCVTLGEAGFDGHPDHSATHRAALEAARTRALEIWALDAGSGELQIEATRDLRAQKLCGMAKHQSQFLVHQSAEGLSDPVRIDDFYLERTWWESDFAIYQPLIMHAEAYNIGTPLSL